MFDLGVHRRLDVFEERKPLTPKRRMLRQKTTATVASCYAWVRGDPAVRWSIPSATTLASPLLSTDSHSLRLQPLNCETDHLSIFGGVLNVPEAGILSLNDATFQRS